MDPPHQVSTFSDQVWVLSMVANMLAWRTPVMVTIGNCGRTFIPVAIRGRGLRAGEMFKVNRRWCANIRSSEDSCKYCDFPDELLDQALDYRLLGHEVRSSEGCRDSQNSPGRLT